MSSTMPIFSAMVFIAATVSRTAWPPSLASQEALPAMPSVTLAFSVFCAMEADICSIAALVSSTEAAWLEAAWLRVWAVAEISSAAPLRVEVDRCTWPMMSLSFSTVLLSECCRSCRWPWNWPCMVRVRSPSARPAMTCMASFSGTMIASSVLLMPSTMRRKSP